MAWTNLTFPFGTTLTASKMNALQNNFTGFATRLSGAPRVVGGADKMCVFSANGHIFSSQGVSSITHGATGSYVFNMTTTFSVGTQINSVASPQFRSVPAVASGFEVNVAYSDNNGRAFTGLSAATTNSGTYPMMTRAGNNSSDIGNFDVYTGCVVWLENTTV
jgi:hypothetical protein|tara:strand:- start:6390 stop:6878 length:489 start_codon:yes stop_codon:yes gene_type:complete